jgi:hypothetical protein
MRLKAAAFLLLCRLSYYFLRSSTELYMFCAKCGKLNSDDAIYCQKCGALLEAEDETRVAVRPNTSPEPEGESEVFSVSPTLMFVKAGYGLAVLGAVFGSVGLDRCIVWVTTAINTGIFPFSPETRPLYPDRLQDRD